MTTFCIGFTLGFVAGAICLAAVVGGVYLAIICTVRAEDEQA